MRKQNKIILWPTYFDSTKTRKQGRKTPRNSALPSPRHDELKKAAQKIGLQVVEIEGASHPKTPWQKTGLIIVPRNTTKTQIIKKLSKELINIRTRNRN